MKRTSWWHALALGLGLPIVLGAQQQPQSGMPGIYSGPNVLSRWNRLPGSTPTGPILQIYVHGSYAYLGGLVGPVSAEGLAVTAPPPTTVSRAIIPEHGSHSLFGGGGLTLNRIESRGSLSINYAANYAGTYSKSANAYRGLNQTADLKYEHQISRRWGFYTGHMGNTQSSILGLTRPTAQRNFFEPAFSPTNEALDARLKSINSGAGFYFQKSSRLTGSFDGGFFAVSRDSAALVSARGERAQGEIAYRLDRNQSIGAIYSFSHFYFPRGFGETFVHSAMLSYTRRINRIWQMQIAAGPYQADSERLRRVPVDPFIASLTGNSSTIEVFQGVARGIGVNASAAAVFRRQNFLTSYRRAVDSGNGVTLSSLNDGAQATYGYQTSRNLGLGASLFFSRLEPLLAGLERSATFQSYGGNFNVSYRLTGYMHLIGNVGVHKISYADLGINQFRNAAMIGLAYSPSAMPLMR